MIAKVSAVIALAILTSATCDGATLYVSATGTGQTCSLGQPCANLADAVVAATAGDTIVCLSSPLAGALRITKALTIDCRGTGVSVRGGYYSTSDNNFAAIVIEISSSAPETLRAVRLRGLTLDGGPTANNPALQRGVDIQGNAAKTAVYVEDCIIANFSQHNVFDHRSGGQTRLIIENSTVSGGRGPGVVVASQGPAVTIFENVSLLNNSFGLAAASGNNVVINRSRISGNTTAGLHADNGAQINLLNSVISHNTANMNAYGTVRLKENDIQFSNVAIQGGGARSAGANRFLGNVTLGSTPTLVSGAPADVYD